MKKILVLTDSLGMPRVKPALVGGDDCWVYRVFDHFSGRFKFRTSSVPGLDSNQLLSMAKDYHQAIAPDVVIIQVGIVDSYPRAIKKNELSLLLRLPAFISRSIHWAVKKRYSQLVSCRKIRYVKPDQFMENMQELKNIFPNAKFLIIPIAPPSAAYISKNPLVASSVDEYNDILNAVFVDGFMQECYTAAGLEDIFLSDNHHLNVTGNRIVFDAVRNALESI